MSCEHIYDDAGRLVAVVTTNKEPEVFDRSRVVGVGFGSSGLFRDGDCVIDGEERVVSDDPLTGEECERIAAADPDHEWTIEINGPLSGGTYLREGREIGRWVCVAQTGGFA